ncbi:MAG: hypothetical protein IT366_07775 [Candidatus Hydrogenedentes bacterium]|nr:hypothetical protein [Candidatus Hydrogenedentota bacterium]
MLRVLKIALIAAIVVLHAVVVPLHVATEHGHHHAIADASGAELAQAHHHEHSVPHTHHEPIANHDTDVLDVHAQLADHSELPPRHADHDHNIAEHSQYRSRTGNPFVAMSATVPVSAHLVVPSSHVPPESYELPPIQAPSLITPSLRGPPSC